MGSPLEREPLGPWPVYSQEELDAVSRVLRSNSVNYWTGDECRQFEKDFAGLIGANYAVALANGTVALEAALTALGIGPGAEVIVTPRSFIASISCVVNVGAMPVFADVSSESGNISADSISKVISPKTRAIICVHLGGWPCDMKEIMEIAAEKHVFVIEDCAQAHGARYRGLSVGSIGHIAAWSFCQDKIMTTGGEGGMVTTNDQDLWRAVWGHKDHGKSYEAVHEQKHPPGYRWLHESFGTNLRMTEMQAAIGRIQVRRMPGWHDIRGKNAQMLTECCKKFSHSLRVPIPPIELDHAWYKFHAYVSPKGLKKGWSRDRIIQAITSRGIPCFSGSCPEVYMEKAFDGTGLRPTTRLSVAKELGETSLMFLVHPTLTRRDMDVTCDVICEVMEDASE